MRWPISPTTMASTKSTSPSDKRSRDTKSMRQKEVRHYDDVVAPQHAGLFRGLQREWKGQDIKISLEGDSSTRTVDTEPSSEHEQHAIARAWASSGLVTIDWPGPIVVVT